MIRKKICWITGDYFIDVDIEIIKLLSNNYEIIWYIVLPQNEARYSLSEIERKVGSQIKIVPIIELYRYRDIRRIKEYWKILKTITYQNPSRIYINFIGIPYFVFLAIPILSRKKTIFAVHQARVHRGMTNQWIFKSYFKILFSYFLNFQLFSETQAALFRKDHPKKNTSVISLTLKDFGISKLRPPKNEIIFFNFGTIIRNKNIGCLIRAACKVYEKGYRNFIVKIFGKCNEWEYYESLIKYPEIFSLKISSIDNNEIADLFCSSHYLVLPYSAVSQSGPLKIAYNYNVPVIASDLDEFKCDISDGVNGYLFDSENDDSLCEVMIKAIENHDTNYSYLKKNQLNYAQQFSKEKILERYFKLFDI